MPDHDVFTLLHVTLELSYLLIVHSMALCHLGEIFMVGLWEDVVNPTDFDMMEPNPLCSIWLHKSYPAQTFQFLHLLNLQYIDMIHFEGPYLLVKVWEPFLQACHHLTILSFKGNVACQLIEMLNKIQECKRAVPGADPTPLIPGLRIIHLSGVLWCRKEMQEEMQEDKVMEALVCLLQERGVTGHPIEKVVINRCRNLDSYDIKTLQEKGITVEWDE